MAEMLVCEDYQTVCGADNWDAGQDSIVMPFEDQYLNLSGYSMVEVRLDVLYLSNVTLALETSPEINKLYWDETISISSATRVTKLLQRTIGTTQNFFEDFLRWKLTPSGSGAWQATFRILVFPRQ
jgi:hypothetical protein